MIKLILNRCGLDAIALFLKATHSLVRHHHHLYQRSVSYCERAAVPTFRVSSTICLIGERVAETIPGQKRLALRVPIVFETSYAPLSVARAAAIRGIAIAGV